MKILRALIYTSVLFILLQLISQASSLEYLLIYSGAGVLGFFVWISISILVRSKREVSKYSSVIIKMKFKERAFYYIAVPTLFYLSISAYLYFLSHMGLSQALIFISTVTLTTYLLSVESSYEKFFYLSATTHVIFSFMNIMIFFVLLSLIDIVLPEYIFVMTVVVVFAVFTLFYFDLLSRKLCGSKAILINMFVSTVFGAAFFFIASYTAAWLFVISGTLLFFLVGSIWQIYLSGQRRLDQFLVPLMFIFMILSVILL